MKVYINTEKSYSNLVYLGSFDWKDFKTKEVKGTKILCGNLDNFEQLEVRMDIKREDIDNKFKKNDKIVFNDLMVNFWSMNDKSGYTFSADSIEGLSPIKLKEVKINEAE